MYVLTSVLYVWQKGKQIFNNKNVVYNHTSSFTILQAGSTAQILLKGPWNWKHKMSSIKHFFYVKLHTGRLEWVVFQGLWKEAIFFHWIAVKHKVFLSRKKSYSLPFSEYVLGALAARKMMNKNSRAVAFTQHTSILFAWTASNNFWSYNFCCGSKSLGRW